MNRTTAALVKSASLTATWSWRLTGLLLAGILLAGPAAAASRVALVLSVESYTAMSKSPLSVVTARTFASGLSRHGYEVIFTENPSNAETRAAVRDFAAKATDADAALILLTGHGATYGGLTYFLPANTEVTRETDLFSRAIAVPSLTQIVSKAKTGAVLFVMSTPNISSTLQGISLRPAYSGTLERTVLAFSTSDKVPVSRIDSVSQQALTDLVDIVREPTVKLSTLLAATTAGGIGRTWGDVSDADWGGTTARVAADAQTAALRQAEDRVRAAEDRARRAEQAAQAAKNASPQPVAPQLQVQTPLTQVTAAPTEDLAALQVVEAMIGFSQRRAIQTRLKHLGFYNGPLDSIFGDLTRAAIRNFQRSRNEAQTGYLTPGQLKLLAHR